MLYIGLLRKRDNSTHKIYSGRQVFQRTEVGLKAIFVCMKKITEILYRGEEGLGREGWKGRG